MTSAQKYRPDIDGLRAIAVLSVVFYHLNLGPFTGGFVGVDVFFVISGYLITKIIQTELAEGSFSFLGFYERRVRRIFPALFVVLSFTLAIAAAILLPSDFVQTARASLSTLAFVSNILFWRTSGYFSPGSELNPLLHTWSLSVEEQFYLVFPPVLLLVHRYARQSLRWILWGVLLVSLFTCIYFQPSKPLATFFLSPFRAWELIIGALLAVQGIPALRSPTLRQIVGSLGLSALVFSLFWIEAGRDFPGWKVSIPVLGTASVIHVGNSGGAAVTRLLSLRPLVFVGLISYSLYLWHWPLVVFTRYVFFETVGTLHMLAVLGTSLILSALSYHFIERSFRKPSAGRKHFATGNRRMFGWAALAASPIVLFAALITANAGFPSRFPDKINDLDAARTPRIPFFDCIIRRQFTPEVPEICRLGNEQKSGRILLWGDSYALAWAPAVDSELSERNMGGILSVFSECPPVEGFPSVFPACRTFNSKVWGHLEKSSEISTVMLIAAWNGYAGLGPHLERTVDRLRAMGKQVVIVGPTPGAAFNVPFRVALASVHGHPLPAPVSPARHEQRSAQFWKIIAGLKQDRLTIIDPTPAFCGGGECRYALKGRVLYRDGGHLNELGAEFVRPLVAPAIARETEPEAPGTTRKEAPAP